MTKTRYALMPIVVVATVLLQMAMPVIARADDGTPPPEQPTEVATDPGTGATDGGTPTDVATPVPVAADATAEVSAATEVPIVTDAATQVPVATEVPVATDAGTPTPEVPLMTQVPEGTDVVVLNADGTVEPLATQAAAEIIATGDPIWCPVSITPGDASCTPIGTYTTLSDLVDFLKTSQPNQAGTIWIEAGADLSASPVTIDGNDFSTSKAFALTLQGGWSGAANTSVNSSTPSLFGVPLSIINWENTVTVNDLSIILPTVTPGPYGYGLDVETTGDITISNVDASGAVFNGAYLANDAGSGDVSVTNGDFSNNSGTGLEVWTTGMIQVDGVTSGNNTNGSGADLNADSQIDVSNSTFNDNGFTGLYAGTSSGAVNLSNVTASGNQYGALVGTDSGDVQVTDSTFNDNTTPDPESDGPGIGLQAGTGLGDITLTNLIATGNDIGALAGTEEGDVLVTGGTGNYSSNHAVGLEAGSASGDVTLNAVIASSNGTVDLDGIGALVGTLDGLITINGGTFDANTYKGLFIETTGIALDPDVTLDNVEASSNSVKGVYIEYLAMCGSTGGVSVNVVDGLYQSNGAFGIYAVVGPDGSLVLDAGTPPDFGLHNGTPADSLYDTAVNTDVSPCPPPEPEPKPEEKPYHVVEVPGTGGEPVSQDCTDYSGTVLVLPGEDKTTLNCPATGEITLQSLVEGGLPGGSLPVGPEFVSALQFGLMDGGQPVTVLTNGGSLKLAFKLPEDAKASDHFAILYWDPSANGGAGGWVELPGFAARPGGTPLVFALHPHAEPDDLMRILSGVRQLGGYAKATVNFTGVFVLVKK